MCWQSSAARDYNLDSNTYTWHYNGFIQVNDFDFFFGIKFLELVDSKAPPIVGLSEQYVPYNL